ncbi:transglutaminase domain-containing protein [Neobacillus sp. SCS-31]|uniref:transglutaminase domain-containing protein n=1 Tax=Neobacillus oceani TaxID=3115292 RepID=UPI003905BD55
MKNKSKYYLALLLSFKLILNLIIPVSASTAGTQAYQVATPEQLRDLLVQKMKERAKSIEIQYTGKPLLGQNQPYLLVENYTKRIPELSFLNETSSFTIADHVVDGYWDMKVSFHYDNTKEEEAFVFHKADTVLKSILRVGMSEEEKLEAIANYIYENVEYDHDQANYNTNPISQTSYGAAKYGLAVCEGYSEYAQILFEKAGLTSYLVGGLVGPIGHQWNLVKINGVWRHVDTTWHTPEQPYINHTTNQYLVEGRSWNYQDFPATPDSPPINPPVIIGKAVQPKAEVKRLEGYTLIEITGVEPGDTLVLYNEKRKMWFYKEISPNDLDFYRLNGQGHFRLYLEDHFNNLFDYQGTFYLSRVTEDTYESDLTFLTYDFRVKTMPIPLTTVRIHNNFSEYDVIKINHSFSNSGDVHLYNEKGVLVDTSMVVKGPNEISFYVKDIEALGKVIYLSAKEYNGIESTKTEIPVPPSTKSKALTNNNFTFTLDGTNGIFAMKNLSSNDEFIIYDGATKRVLSKGKGNTRAVIKNLSSYKQVYLTRKSSNQLESSPYTYTLPKPPKSKALTSKNVKVTKADKRAKFTFTNIPKNAVITLYDGTTNRKITSFSIKTNSHTYYLADSKKYNKVHVNITETGKAASPNYTVSIPH